MHEICASAPTVFTIDTSRAVSTVSRLLAVATSRARRLYCRITFAVQNLAVLVSAVFGFAFEPCTSSSSTASTHCWLCSDGGAGGKNCAALSRMNGRTFATHGVCGARYGGVSRQTPGPGESVGNDEVDAIGVCSPSPSRSAISLAAANAP